MEIKITSHLTHQYDSIFFTGDVHGESGFWESDPISEKVCEDVFATDLATANLEAPLDGSSSETKYGPVMTSTESTLETLHSCGFNAISLANNHILDNGVEGLENTIETSKKIGLKSFGAGHDHKDAVAPLQKTVGDAEIALVSVCEHTRYTADANSPGAAWSHSPVLYSTLESIASSHDVTVLVAHGGLEYVPLPPENWRNHLRSLSSAGVDVIVSHHPHTPQGWEVYEKTPIFYSLGNFMLHRSKWPSTEISYGVQIEVDHGNIVGINVVPLTAKNGKITYFSKIEDNDLTAYLQETSQVLADDERYSAYWQEMVSRLFWKNEYRYQYYHRLREYGVGQTLSFLYDPVRELDRITRGIVGEQSTREKHLAIRSYIGNKSHQAAIQTAIDLHTGAIQDKRDDEVSRNLDRLFDISDGRPDRSFTERQIDRMKTVVRRLRDK